MDHINFMIMALDGVYKNEVRDGDWKSYRYNSNQIDGIITYKDGVKKAIKEFDANGKIKWEETFLDGKAGVKKIYRDGKLFRTSVYDEKGELIKRENYLTNEN